MGKNKSGKGSKNGQLKKSPNKKEANKKANHDKTKSSGATTAAGGGKLSDNSSKKSAHSGKSNKSKKTIDSSKQSNPKSKEKSGKEKSGKEKSGKEKSGKEKSGKEKNPKLSVKKEDTIANSNARIRQQNQSDTEEEEIETAKSSKNEKKTVKKAITKESGNKVENNASESENKSESESKECTEKEAVTDSDEVASKQFKAKPKAKETKNGEYAEKAAKKEPPKLEFTKPTINQMVREEERIKHPKPPLVNLEKIDRQDFESFNDEVEEMTASVQMLRMSYGSIIKSLVAMYTKRAKKGQPAQLPPTVDGKVNFLTPVMEDSVAQERSCLEWADKYDMERFINPANREEAFQMLFAEVDLLLKKTEKLRTRFYDKEGYFDKEKYDGQQEIKVTRKQLNEFWLWTRKLTSVIDEIARNYNDDLLNMFRLH